MLIYLISTDKALLTALHHLINYTDNHTSETYICPAQLFIRVKQQSGVEYGHYLCAHASRVYVFSGGNGLAQPLRTELETIQHHDR